MIDVTDPRMRPARDPLRSLIYSAGDRVVRHVIVDGGFTVRDGKLLTIDYDAAAAILHEAQKRVEAAVPSLDWAHRSAAELSPVSLRTM